jgi:hypothetical protein
MEPEPRSQGKKITKITVIEPGSKAFGLPSTYNRFFMCFPTTLHAGEDDDKPPTTITLVDTNAAHFFTLMKILSLAQYDPVFVSLKGIKFLCRPHSLREIAKYCNETAIEIIKKLANNSASLIPAYNSPEVIINVVTYIGDDGNYEWIAPNVVNKTLAFFESLKEEKDGASKLARISPQFVTYIFLHGKRKAVDEWVAKRKIARGGSLEEQ